MYGFYSVEELCGILHVSRKTLQNYFVAYTGLSPHAYQISAKLEQARALIERSPEIKLHEIASRYGFCDEYHFSKMFKARYGFPPKGKKS